jgi:hypothetical protein
MKKFLALISTLIPLFIFLPNAHSATPVIRIIDIPHRNFDGTFRDNELEKSLTPDGKLGKALFRGSTTATWVIDAHLIDEVIDMSDGYIFAGEEQPLGSSIASIWLQQLKVATTGSPIVALPYGNPDPALARKLAPSEIKFYSQLAEEKLETFFGRPVISQNGWSSGKSRLESQYQEFYSDHRSLLLGLNKVIDVPEIVQLRARLGITLNPLLDAEERAYFSYSARDAVSEVAAKLKIVSGRYQLTSETVKVPLTLVNKFDTATTVSLWLTPMNSRVQVQDVTNITIPPRSQIQIEVPFTVIASGSTLVTAQFASVDGFPIGEVSKLNLSLTVIDSRITWFTTGAAILLFAGAITQSFRRVRRSRNEK